MNICRIGDTDYRCEHIQTAKANLLLILGTRGFLGCGYFDIQTADKLNEAVAIVTGVSDCKQMLDKPVVRCSKAATALGVREGMTGRAALKCMA